MKRIFEFYSQTQEDQPIKVNGPIILNETLIKRSFLDWMKTKSPGYLEYYAEYLPNHWVTEVGLVPVDESDLYRLDEMLADIKWEYIKGVCHEY